MTGFSYEIRERSSQSLELVLMGYMDEEVELPPIELFKNCTKIIVNFRMVKAILSIGIKKWIQFSDELEQIPNLSVEFKDCSKQVVDQINLVDGFLPENGKVSSIFVPVFCEKCNRAFKVLKSTENIKENLRDVIRTMEDVDCDDFPGCKEFYELEVNPVAYLKFLKS